MSIEWNYPFLPGKLRFEKYGHGGQNGRGLVGSRTAEGVKAAAGTGPRPWLKIPLTAVSSCGLRNEKEFFIAADQTYVLENENDDVFLPDLAAQAKTKGI